MSVQITNYQKVGTIYVLRNKINGKCYVGQTTVPLARRLSEHKCKGQIISKALRLYGEKAFESFQVEGLPIEALDDFEKELIARLGSRSPAGYNLDGGGVRTRIRPTGKDHPMYGRKGASNPWFGRHHSEETKKKLSIALKGRMAGPLNPMFGRPSPSLGKKFSEEHKKKIGDAHRGRKHSKERIEINRLSHLGLHPGAETRRKMSESHKGLLKGRTHTEETKAKIREARRLYFLRLKRTEQ